MIDSKSEINPTTTSIIKYSNIFAEAIFWTLKYLQLDLNFIKSEAMMKMFGIKRILDKTKILVNACSWLYNSSVLQLYANNGEQPNNVVSHLQFSASEA